MIDVATAAAGALPALVPDVVAIGLVGSHARGTARPDSDVDLVVLTGDPSRMLDRSDWFAAVDLGAVLIRSGDFGALQERRLLLPDGTVVEVAVGDSSWAATGPVDAGTRTVVEGGLRILYDPHGLLAELLENVTHAPIPFQLHESGALLHGTKAALVVGDLLVPGRPSNFEPRRTMNHVYVTKTLDAAAWGAELALGDGPGRIYLVEPTGPIEDDPNVTDKKFPGNPTHSFRTRSPVRVVGELTDWTGHTAEQIQSRRDGLADLRRRGLAVILD